jgi:hypothetical protein
MGGEVIERDMVDELQRVAANMVGIAADHRTCRASHCDREVAEEAVGTLDLVSGHGEIVEGGAPDGVGKTAARVRDLLASAEGTHG